MKSVNYREDNPATILVHNEHGDAVRINFDDFKPGEHKVHASSHRNHDGSDAGDGDATDVPAPKGGNSGKSGKGGKGGKGDDDGQVYTVEDGGKFYRTDKEGNRLNPEGFATAELAAAAPVVPA